MAQKKQSSVVINGSFEAIDGNIKVLSIGQVNVTTEDIPLKMYNCYLDNSGKMLEVDYETDTKQFFGISGTLRVSSGPRFGIPVKNATMIVYKDGRVYDYTVSDENGDYVLYLEKGDANNPVRNYTIKIQGAAISKSVNLSLDANGIDNSGNIEGINEFKTLIRQCQVIERKFDFVKPYDYRAPGSGDRGVRYIHGTIVNENGQAVEGAEIIIAKTVDRPKLDTESDDDYNNRPKIQGEVMTFARTDENGKYGFAVELVGALDIILRYPDAHAKVLRKYVINAEPKDSFINSVTAQALSFNKGGNSLGYNS